MAQPGRLRRPGRGLKSKRIRQQTIQKNASHTEFLTLPARHVIENFFAKLKQYRAIATRYDKTARNFLGAIHLVASMVWLA